MTGRLLSPTDLADRWNMSAETLQQWRRTGKGPLYIKIGHNVRYAMDEVLAFESENRRGRVDDGGWEMRMKNEE